MNLRKKSRKDWGRLALKFKKLSAVGFYATERVNINILDLENYISTENMNPNKEGVTNASKLPSAKTTSAFKKGDILISNIRPYFKKIWYADKDGGCSNDVLVIRASDGIDSKFLYYVLADDNFFDYTTGSAKGTKMPRGDKSAIMQYQVPDLSFERQREISKILSSLDDRIAENKKINHHLEQMLQISFSELINSSALEKFILYDLADIIDNRGKTPPLVDSSEFPIIDVRTLAGETRLVEYGNVQKYVSEETYNNWFRNGHPQKYDSLISTVGSVGAMKMFLQNKGTIAQNVVALRSKNAKGIFLYQLLLSLQKKLKAYDIGSVQPSIKVTQFMKQEINIPRFDIISKWESNNLPFVELTLEKQLEIENLIVLRDSLLPKLMSGEITID